MPDNVSIPLYLFAKAPEPGLVKTRMQPDLSPDTCADLAAEMLGHSAQQIRNFWPGTRVLCVSPVTTHPQFDQLVDDAGFDILMQVNADLGTRMLAALDHGLSADASSAVVMGCDVPYIDGAILKQAWSAMQKGHNVIGPALDGGFYLLGCHRLPIAAFRDVDWGTDRVLSTVIHQGQLDGMEFVTLPVLRDIDRPADLAWLASRDRRYQRFIRQKPEAAHG